MVLSSDSSDRHKPGNRSAIPVEPSDLPAQPPSPAAFVVRRPLDPSVIEFTGLLSISLYLAAVLLYLGVRWRADRLPWSHFVVSNYPRIEWAILLGATFVGLYTVIRGVILLWEPQRTLPDRLKAGYGISYASFALVVAGLTLALTRYL